MGTKSRETIYGSSIRASAERAAEARKEADRLGCEAWNQRMLGYRGPAQPSPMLSDALNAGFRYLEVRCLGCDTHQSVALDIVRRPKTTPVHELERYMRCRDCSEVRGYPYKRSHLVALRTTKISASDPLRRSGQPKAAAAQRAGRVSRSARRSAEKTLICRLVEQGASGWHAWMERTHITFACRGRVKLNERRISPTTREA